MATLFVIRHGRAAGNSEHRFIGQSNVPLDTEGRRQAEVLASRLAGEGIERIVTSDLERAIDTVRPLAVQVGVRIEADARVREIANGEWTGLLPAEIAARWPELWQAYAAGEDVPRPGGERWSQVRQRVVPVALELGSGEGKVVLCTHGGPALILAMWAAGITHQGNIFRGPLAAAHNASITTIGFPGPRLVSFNDTGHLGSSPDQSLAYESVPG
jgi:probable phosphoglycerate mutase